MPFMTIDILRTHLTPSRVDSFIGAAPDQLEKMIATADKLITSHAKIQPPANATDASPEVQRFAAWIISYLMTDGESGISEDAYDRRLDKYRLAIKELDAMEGVEVDETTAAVGVTTASTERIGEML